MFSSLCPHPSRPFDLKEMDFTLYPAGALFVTVVNPQHNTTPINVDRNPQLLRSRSLVLGGCEIRAFAEHPCSHVGWVLRVLDIVVAGRHSQSEDTTYLF